MNRSLEVELGNKNNGGCAASAIVVTNSFNKPTYML